MQPIIIFPSRGLDHAAIAFSSPSPKACSVVYPAAVPGQPVAQYWTPPRSDLPAPGSCVSQYLTHPHSGSCVEQFPNSELPGRLHSVPKHD